MIADEGVSSADDDFTIGPSWLIIPTSISMDSHDAIERIAAAATKRRMESGVYPALFINRSDATKFVEEIKEHSGRDSIVPYMFSQPAYFGRFIAVLIDIGERALAIDDGSDVHVISLERIQNAFRKQFGQ